jgi:hypothetical protein
MVAKAIAFVASGVCILHVVFFIKLVEVKNLGKSLPFYSKWHAKNIG